MKKLFLLIFAAIFMFSCGGGKGSDSNADSDTEFNDSDCLDCNDGDSGGNGYRNQQGQNGNDDDFPKRVHGAFDIVVPQHLQRREFPAAVFDVHVDEGI